MWFYIVKGLKYKWLFKFRLVRGLIGVFGVFYFDEGVYNVLILDFFDFCVIFEFGVYLILG